MVKDKSKDKETPKLEDQIVTRYAGKYIIMFKGKHYSFEFDHESTLDEITEGLQYLQDAVEAAKEKLKKDEEASIEEAEVEPVES